MSFSLPEPLADELVRDRIIERLAGRWEHSITTVVAAGGFGKSIALAQAIRDNAEDPTGIDVYVNLARTPGGLAGTPDAVRAQLGQSLDARATDPVDDLVAVLAACSPSLVCLHLDDAHVLIGDEAAVGALAALIYRLPGNARMVIAARQLPALPLARVRAGDQLLEIGEDLLVFDDAEVALLADRHGRAPTTISSSGWPALSRLSLVAGSEASIEYLLEEVLGSLDDRQRQALALAVIGGVVDAQLLGQVGSSPRELARAVPLVALLPDERVVAHDLWSEVVGRIVDDDTARALVRATVMWLRSNGRATEAVELALAHSAWDETLASVMEVIVHGGDGLTAQQCARWLGRLPAALSDRAEVAYLQWVSDRLARGIPPDDERLWAATQTFRALGEPYYEAAAMFEVAVAAWNRGDLGRFIEVAGHFERLIAEGVDWMMALATLGTAMTQELMGDVAGALELSRSVDFDRLPSGVAELCLRHAAGLAFVLGRSGEGRELTERLVERRPGAQGSFLLDVALFLDGDPSPVRGAWPDPAVLGPGNARDEFVFGFYAAMVHAAFGRPFTMPPAPSFAMGREHLLATLADVALGVGGAGEAERAEQLRDALGAVGGVDQIVASGLALFCAYPYVLLPETRPFLDSLSLGPAFERQRAVARAFVRARQGLDPQWSALDDPAAVVCSLPLVWSVELAVHGAAAGVPAGMRLAGGLIDIVGVAARDLLRSAAERGGRFGDAAAGLLAAEAVAPSEPVWVQIIGPTLVTRPGGGAIGVRRRRVRELLCLLALRPRWRRAELTSLLWPDLGADRARANLAITLTYLRQELEPERRSGEATFHLRQDADLVWLHRSERLRIDLWDVVNDLERAGVLRAEHRPLAALGHLDAAVRRWIGPVAGDVAHLDEVVPLLVGIERSLLDAALDVARWKLADGEPTEALVLAERVLAVDGANEAAHAVVLGAHLSRGDRVSAQLARERMAARLTEAGARPGAQTQMLWRRLEMLAPSP